MHYSRIMSQAVALVTRRCQRWLNRVGRRQFDRRVGFLICGAQKCGTSALASYLREHPEICLADTKEVHYFDDELAFRHERPDYAAYHAYFTPRGEQRLLGEATPIYMYWHDAPRRIWQYNPEMKLIVMLRNPIERAYSHWNMERELGQETLSFWEAIRSETDRCRAALPLQHRRYSYVDRGFYSEQLRRLWRFFPREQLLVLTNDELKQEPQAALDKVCDFLQLRPLENAAPRVVHARTYQSPITPREWDYLAQLYEPEVAALEQLLGWDCRAWLEQPVAC